MIIGTSYQLQHRKAEVQRAVNMMPVVNETSGVAYLDAVPGLVTFSAVDGALLQENRAYLLQESDGWILLE